MKTQMFVRPCSGFPTIELPIQEVISCKVSEAMEDNDSSGLSNAFAQIHTLTMVVGEMAGLLTDGQKILLAKKLGFTDIQEVFDGSNPKP